MKKNLIIATAKNLVVSGIPRKLQESINIFLIGTDLHIPDDEEIKIQKLGEMLSDNGTEVYHDSRMTASIKEACKTIRNEMNQLRKGTEFTLLIVTNEANFGLISEKMKSEFPQIITLTSPDEKTDVNENTGKAKDGLVEVPVESRQISTVPESAGKKMEQWES